MVALGVRLGTYFGLGPANLARVAIYRLGLKTGLHPVLKLKTCAAPSGSFFAARSSSPPPGAVARQDWRETGLWFGAHAFPAATAPDWHRSPFTGAHAEAKRPWQSIADFDPALGDIKAVWEASRFDWLLAMAQRAAFGDPAELDRLNAWLADWSAANPPYRGANWKCGQEASIRVLHLALAAMQLDQAEKPPPALAALVRLHLARIAPTMGYAIGQANNHATSEAAALFVGGSWLGGAEGDRWARTGRRQLERQALRLIAPDGTFSQYSLVYHRVMLDTFCFAESWRRGRRLPAFSSAFLKRLQAATRWLQQLTDPATGDGPNLGANDGARLMALSDNGFRDFRPTLQWAAALFLDRRGIAAEGPWDQPLLWLGIALPTELLDHPASTTFDDGGLHVLRAGNAVAYLRYPRFGFRPSQADALHLDLWVDGDNILRDAGTYSYNSADSDDLSGTAAHNTVQFDGRDQMPRLGRFLFGAWLKGRGVRPVTGTGEAIEAAAGYRDYRGAEHHREVRLEPGALLCTDRLSGHARSAVLRWRLRPGDWRLEGNSVTDGTFKLTVETDGGAAELSLTSGPESRHYLEKTNLPVLEAAVRVPAIIRTRVES
ncbi:alginate lyase family protein [Sphingomonas sp.]|uniref:heparinase II/III family protein n=1 Tax=Sphingomonas sp. TaxID=28214 RepID=UPI00286DFF00|nr:alginate lyase family protein [Sphingomonas sp.]